MSEFVVTHPLVAKLERYVVVTSFNRGRADMAPFGLQIPHEHRIDPTRMDNETFLALLQNLDGRTFGPEGMPMDRWVFYDCCYMPGIIMGFGKRARDMTDKGRALLEVPDDYDGLVPYSMYIAIPMASSPTDWMGHNLASIAPQLPDENLGGLGTMTKAVALKCFGSKGFYGATQWSSKALHIHVKFGPLDLLTAYTPAHSDSETLTYGFECTDTSLLAALKAPGYTLERPAPDLWITEGDSAAMMALQDRIEAGERFVIPGAPDRSGPKARVPVSQLTD